MPTIVRPRRLLGAVALALLLPISLAAAPALGDSGDPLAYEGGPVEHSVTGVLVDWGAGVSPTFTNPTTGDAGLLRYLASQSGTPGDIGGVLAQYMDASGANAANQVSYGGQFQITPQPGGTVQDAQLGAQLVGQIEAGTLPHPAGNGLSTIYVVLFPPRTTICNSEGCSGQAFCSYHGSTAMPDGTEVVYLVIPDDTTGPMQQGCGTGSALQNQTMYLSHEWSEAVTDPLVDQATSLGPPLSWYDANCPTANAACGEVADKCNLEPTVEGGWTVQLVWSDLDRACVGAEPRYGTPNVSFTPPATASAGVALSFAAGATDPPGNTASVAWNGSTFSIPPGIQSLTWNWGDGSPVTSGAAAVHTYTAPGVYDVTLTALDDLGFAATASHQIDASGPSGAPAAQPGAPTATRSRPGGTQAQAAAAAKPRHRRGRHRRSHHHRRGSPRMAAVSGRRPAVSARPAVVVPITASVLPDQPLAAALRGGLRISFRCERPCLARLQATLALPGVLGAVAVPRVLATGTGTLVRAGQGTARLEFSSSARGWLSSRRAASFAVSGYVSAR